MSDNKSNRYIPLTWEGDEVFVEPDLKLIAKAINLFLPDLDPDDPRFKKLQDFCVKDYRGHKDENGKWVGRNMIVLLIRNDRAKSPSIAKVSNFLRELDLDPGLREVTMDRRVLRFTPNYKVPPVAVQ